MSDALKAILAAQGMVAKTTTGTNVKKDGTATLAVLPTARTRTALDTLANNTAQSLADLRLDMRALVTDLFAWSGKPRFNKPLMHKVNALVSDPKRYQHNVELIAYAVAVSRMLDADRLVRVLDTKVETVYAPARYTLQFAQKLEKVFGKYQPQRQEQLVISLWEIAHEGRWWDIHTPVDAGNGEVTLDNDAILENFLDNSLAYSKAYARVLNKVGPNAEIVEKLRNYTLELAKGVPVDPDVAVFSSYLSWLPTSIRPESPVAAVLQTYIELSELIEYEAPKAPESFDKMFPNVQLYSGEQFPYHESVMRLEGNHGHLRVEVIRSAGALEENRNFMGNCTGSYLTRLLQGTTFILRIFDREGNVYNAAASGTEGQVWRLGEINSRHNRGNVPATVRELAATMVGNLPRVQLNTEYAKIQELNERVKAATGTAKRKKYRYTV